MLAGKCRRFAPAAAPTLALAVACAVAFAAACGARSAALNEGPGCPDARIPPHPDLLVLNQLADSDIDSFVRAAVALVEQVQRDAAAAFHADQLPSLEGADGLPASDSVEVRRAFLDRYVYVDPQVLQVGGPGFRWNPELVLAVAARARNAGRSDLIELWFAALAPFSYEAEVRTACLSNLRGRPFRATLVPTHGNHGARWTRLSF